ncbi:MAG: hypothetical protein OER90_07455 [Gemmatimonadota bacterium]|nr:hypothetical protein [Gemmatimonadota bacterium]
MRRLMLLAIAVAVLLPTQALAQDDELARGMFFSHWQCPPALVGDIAAAYDSLIRPIEQELVNEGLMYGAGMFFHQWGDEYNVNWYRLGQDRDQVFDAIDEIGRRMEQRHPDAPNQFEECTAHKDNIYWWGPRTSPPPQ